MTDRATVQSKAAETEAKAREAAGHADRPRAEWGGRWRLGLDVP